MHFERAVAALGVRAPNDVIDAAAVLRHHARGRALERLERGQVVRLEPEAHDEIDARLAHCLAGRRSKGWFTPSLVGTFGMSNGSTPSRQPTLNPYSFGFRRRW